MKLIVNGVASVEADFFKLDENQFKIEKNNLTKEQTLSFFEIFPKGTKINIKLNEENYDLKVTSTGYQNRGTESLINDKVSISFEHWTDSDEEKVESKDFNSRLFLEIVENELSVRKLVYLLHDKGVIDKEEYNDYWNGEEYSKNLKEIYNRFFEDEIKRGSLEEI